MLIKIRIKTIVELDVTAIDTQIKSLRRIYHV